MVIVPDKEVKEVDLKPTIVHSTASAGVAATVARRISKCGRCILILIGFVCQLAGLEDGQVFLYGVERWMRNGDEPRGLEFRHEVDRHLVRLYVNVSIGLHLPAYRYRARVRTECLSFYIAVSCYWPNLALSYRNGVWVTSAL